MLRVTCREPSAGNYPESPDSCLPLQLTGGEDVAQVLADGAHIDVEQLSHQLPRQPHRLMLVPRLDTAAPSCAVKIRNSAVELRINLRCGSAEEE